MASLISLWIVRIALVIWCIGYIKTIYSLNSGWVQTRFVGIDGLKKSKPTRISILKKQLTTGDAKEIFWCWLGFLSAPIAVVLIVLSFIFE